MSQRIDEAKFRALLDNITDEQWDEHGDAISAYLESLEKAPTRAAASAAIDSVMALLNHTPSQYAERVAPPPPGSQEEERNYRLYRRLSSVEHITSQPTARK